MTAPLLKVYGLGVLGSAGQPLLSDVSFELGHREVVGLLGPNGAGKTSLLRCLYGSQQHYSGSIELHGQKLSAFSAKQRARHIAAVVQESPADFQLSVAAVIGTGRTCHQHWLSGKDDRAEAVLKHYIEHFQLENYLDRDITELSGGERKRVMLCRALVQEPELLLLDEPCNHLDIEHQLSLLEQLRSLPMTCLISLHDLPQAVRYCDRLLIMHQGRLVSVGRAQEVLTDELLERVFAISANTYSNPWQAWSYFPRPSAAAIKVNPTHSNSTLITN